MRLSDENAAAYREVSNFLKIWMQALCTGAWREATCALGTIYRAGGRE